MSYKEEYRKELIVLIKKLDSMLKENKEAYILSKEELQKFRNFSREMLIKNGE